MWWNEVSRNWIKSDQNGIESKYACIGLGIALALIKSDQNGIESSLLKRSGTTLPTDKIRPKWD